MTLMAAGTITMIVRFLKQVQIKLCPMLPTYCSIGREIATIKTLPVKMPKYAKLNHRERRLKKKKSKRSKTKTKSMVIKDEIQSYIDRL